MLKGLIWAMNPFLLRRPYDQPSNQIHQNQTKLTYHSVLVLLVEQFITTSI